jgi:hypothetical protein
VLFWATRTSILECEVDPNELRLSWNFTHTFTKEFPRSPQFFNSNGFVNHLQIRKMHIRPGFCWGFQDDFKFHHNQKTAPTGRMEWFKECILPSNNPQQQPQLKNSKVLPRSKEKRKGKRVRTKSNQNYRKEKTAHDSTNPMDG